MKMSVDTTLCEVCPLGTAVDRKITGFVIKTKNQIEGDTRRIRNKSLPNELKNLFCSLPILCWNNAGTFSVKYKGVHTRLSTRGDGCELMRLGVKMGPI